MKNNPLLVLDSLGQSVWLDYLGRGAIQSGQLQRLIEEEGVSGVTSNRSLFDKAIVESHDYDCGSPRFGATEQKRVGGLPGVDGGRYPDGCGPVPPDLQPHQRR